MATAKHISSSLRLVDTDARPHRNLRTFSGARPDLDRARVDSFIRGINALKVPQATNAVLTVRAELVREP